MSAIPLLPVVVMAKAPVAGRVKTRLVPVLGAEGAARLARALLEDGLRNILIRPFAVELAATAERGTAGQNEQAEPT